MLEQNEEPLILRQLTRIFASAAFGAQEFGQVDPPHYLCKAVANMNQKVAENATQSPHF